MPTPSRKRATARSSGRSARPAIPGGPVRGSSTGRPIMAVLDLMGRRWVLRILWELRDGPIKFRELQARCGDLSPTIVSRRLTDLRAALLVEHAPESGYRLTELGGKLGRSLEPLWSWSEAWEIAIREAGPRKK